MREWARLRGQWEELLIVYGRKVPFWCSRASCTAPASHQELCDSRYCYSSLSLSTDQPAQNCARNSSGQDGLGERADLLHEPGNSCWSQRALSRSIQPGSHQRSISIQRPDLRSQPRRRSALAHAAKLHTLPYVLLMIVYFAAGMRPRAHVIFDDDVFYWH